MYMPNASSSIDVIYQMSVAKVFIGTMEMLLILCVVVILQWSLAKVKKMLLVIVWLTASHFVAFDPPFK